MLRLNRTKTKIMFSEKLKPVFMEPKAKYSLYINLIQDFHKLIQTLRVVSTKIINTGSLPLLEGPLNRLKCISNL